MCGVDQVQAHPASPHRCRRHTGEPGEHAADTDDGQRAEAPAETLPVCASFTIHRARGPDDQPIHHIGADEVIEGIGRGVSHAGRCEDAAVETDEVGSEACAASANRMSAGRWKPRLTAMSAAPGCGRPCTSYADWPGLRFPCRELISFFALIRIICGKQRIHTFRAP